MPEGQVSEVRADADTGEEVTGLSACVITFQEEERIGDCLDSLSVCDDILVVDSGSTDRTREIAQSKGARVIVNAPFPGYREQKQFAVDHAHHDWILSLDADERITPALHERVLQLKQDHFPDVAYSMPRRNFYLGKRIHHGLFAPEPKVRLFNRANAGWGGRNPHDRVELKNGAASTPLIEPFDHHKYRTLREHIRQIDSFTRLDAEAKHLEGRKCTLVGVVVGSAAIVFKGLLLKVGFLDGWRGLVICGMAGYYNWLKCWRLRQLNKKA